MKSKPKSRWVLQYNVGNGWNISGANSLMSLKEKRAFINDRNVQKTCKTTKMQYRVKRVKVR